MTVTWSTKNATESAIAFYGIGQLTHIATGSVTRFVDPGMEHHVQYIHRVTMTSLKPGNKYGKYILCKQNFRACVDPESLSEGVHLLRFFFLVDEGREDPNTTISGPSLAHQRSAI